MRRPWVSLVLVWVLGACPVAFAAARPPNIVFILADDLGWSDTGFAGSRYYETPNLDAFAASGMRFTSFYMSQNCAPSRASLFSGQYAPRTGVYTVDSLERGDAAARKMGVPANATSLPAATTTVAAALKSAGYVTGIFGKWHLGTEPGQHPRQRGFDEALLSAGKHFGFVTDPPLETPATNYLADFLTDKALDFVQRHKEAPFFLHLAHFGVHVPHEAKRELVARFEKKPPGGGHRDAVYAAMIASLDESVGRVLAGVEQLGLSSNTLVIFASDNGGVGGYGEPDANGRRLGVTDNAPLHGGKGMLYDGGLRVPFLARWLGVIAPGSRTTQPCLHVDLFPTLCDVAGARPPTNHVLDGVSLLPLLRNAAAPLGRDAIFWHFPGYLEAYGRPGWRTTPAGAIRAGNFKLLEFFEDGRLELYNLIDDIGEKNNLVRSLPDKTKELQAKLAHWRKEVGAAMPTNLPPRPPPAAFPAVATRTPLPATPPPTQAPDVAPTVSPTNPTPASVPAPPPTALPTTPTTPSVGTPVPPSTNSPAAPPPTLPPPAPSTNPPPATPTSPTPATNSPPATSAPAPPAPTPPPPASTTPPPATPASPAPTTNSPPTSPAPPPPSTNSPAAPSAPVPAPAPSTNAPPPPKPQAGLRNRASPGLASMGHPSPRA